MEDVSVVSVAFEIVGLEKNINALIVGLEVDEVPEVDICLQF